MDELRVRAMALLDGLCCFSPNEPFPTVVGLLQEYAASGELSEQQLLEQLPQCIRFAGSQALDLDFPEGSTRDAKRFYENAGTILRAIDLALMAR